MMEDGGWQEQIVVSDDEADVSQVSVVGKQSVPVCMGYRCELEDVANVSGRGVSELKYLSF